MYEISLLNLDIVAAVTIWAHCLIAAEAAGPLWSRAPWLESCQSLSSGGAGRTQNWIEIFRIEFEYIQIIF